MKADPSEIPSPVPSTTTAKFSFSLGRLSVSSPKLNTSPISTHRGQQPQQEILSGATTETVQSFGHPASQKSVRVPWTPEVGGKQSSR